jgi:hypothetical protein
MSEWISFVGICFSNSASRDLALPLALRLIGRVGQSLTLDVDAAFVLPIPSSRRGIPLPRHFLPNRPLSLVFLSAAAFCPSRPVPSPPPKRALHQRLAASPRHPTFRHRSNFTVPDSIICSFTFRTDHRREQPIQAVPPDGICLRQAHRPASSFCQMKKA